VKHIFSDIELGRNLAYFSADEIWALPASVSQWIAAGLTTNRAKNIISTHADTMVASAVASY
jgi:hypothetical protein